MEQTHWMNHEIQFLFQFSQYKAVKQSYSISEWYTLQTHLTETGNLYKHIF